MINTKQEYDEQVDKLLALSVAYYDNDKRFSPASPLRKGWEDVNPWLPRENQNGEYVEIFSNRDHIEVRTYQDNGHVRVNTYWRDGTREETFDGRWE